MDKRVELRISLDDGGINIPYQTGESDRGETFPYRRLVDHPELIDEIPEVQEFLQIRDALSKINQPGHTFETARILIWRAEEVGYSTVCVTGFYFQDREKFADLSECYRVAGNLLTAMLGDDLMGEQAFSPMLEIQKANLKDEGCSGWIMDLYLAGTSDADPVSADDELQRKVSWLADFLNRQT